MGKVYVIGGIVDESPKKKMTLDSAISNGVKSVRLPIREYLERDENSKKGSYNVILTPNQVLEILLKHFETNDWTKALKSAVPKRFGFKVDT